MTMPRSRVVPALLAITLAACGGLTDVNTPHGDGGSTDSSVGSGGHETGFACVLVPASGEACSTTSSLCTPNDPCAESSWECVDHTWETVVNPACSGDDVTGDDATTTEAGDDATEIEAGDDATSFEGGADDTTGDDSGEAAVCSTCDPGTICVQTTSSGGPCLEPNDAGVCPDGSDVGPDQCCNTSSTSYACMMAPGECTEGLTCQCAASLCGDGCQCIGPQQGVFACQCDFP